MKNRLLSGLALIAALLVTAVPIPARAQTATPGGTIAFAGVDAENNATLYVMNLASGAVGRIDTPVSAEVSFAWQPGGDSLAFTTEDGGYGLLRSLRGCFDSNALCLDIVEVYPPFMVTQIEWTPDGEQLYLLAEDEGLQISPPRGRPSDITALDTACEGGFALAGEPPYLFCAASLGDNIEAQVYESDVSGDEPAFTQLYELGTFPALTAYDIAPGGSAAIGTLETAGDSGFYAPADGSPGRLADYQIHIYDLAFQPDAARFAIAAATSDSTGDGTLRDDDPGELFLFDMETAALQQIPGFTDARTLTWSPDGAHILVVTGEQTLKIYTPESSLVSAVPVGTLPEEAVITRLRWHPADTLALPIIPTATPGGTSTPIPTPTVFATRTPFPSVTPFPTLTPYPTLTPFPSPTRIPSATPGSPIGQACQYAYVGGGGLPVAIGDTAEVTQYGAAVRLRTAPMLDATMLAELLPGTRMIIRSGPYCGQGYRWWEIQLEGKSTIGYVADSDPNGLWIQMVAPTPTQPAEMINFYADAYTINQGSCTTLRWDLEGIKAVYFQGTGVTGHETRNVCPANTTTYELRVVRNDNSEVIRQVTIFVVAP